MELILVAGFLGAGKTTLLKRILGLYTGKRVHLIVNEFGRVGVDGALLAHRGATMDEIVNGSIFCACRLDQFEDALDRAQADAPDVILVEASGLSDPTAIRTVLEQSGRYPGIRYKGCITLADATRLHKVIDTARVCAKQLSVADLIALTKTDVVTAEQRDAARALFRTRYPGVPIVEAIHGDLPRAAMEALSPCRPAFALDENRDLTLQKALVAVSPDMSSDQLRAFLRLFVEETHRVKGLARLKDGAFEVDCVGAYVNVAPFSGGGINNRLVALSGAGMSLRKSLRAAIGWYEGLVWAVKDDEPISDGFYNSSHKNTINI